jgi:GT2 family glycosyltransferase
MPPAISIYVPTRNRARDLAVRLQDLGHQTASDFELVILHDGSTDATRHAGRSRDDLGHALEGAPGTVRLIARVVSRS